MEKSLVIDNDETFEASLLNQLSGVSTMISPSSTLAMRKQAAFTLIEIMIVVAIIGLLASIFIPYFWKSREESTRKACVASLVQIYQAKVRWALDVRKLPTDVPLDTDLFGTNGYIIRKPACPAGGIYDLRQVDEQPTCTIGDHGVP